MFAFMLSCYIQRSVIIRFLVSSGGGDVMNLVYGSSSSSYMDYEVHLVRVLRFASLVFVSPSALTSTPSSLTSSYMDVPYTV